MQKHAIFLYGFEFSHSLATASNEQGILNFSQQGKVKRTLITFKNYCTYTKFYLISHATTHRDLNYTNFSQTARIHLKCSVLY